MATADNYALEYEHRRHIMHYVQAEMRNTGGMVLPVFLLQFLLQTGLNFILVVEASSGSCIMSSMVAVG